MKRTSCIILLFFTIQLAFAQKTTQKSYSLYGKHLENDVVVHKQNSINDTGNGIISIEHLDQKIEGELIKFSVISATRTKFGKNDIERTFLKRKNNFIATIMDQTISKNDSLGPLIGKTVIATMKDNTQWTIPKFDTYSEGAQLLLIEELNTFNDSVIKTETYFNYPKKMRIGEQFELNTKNIHSFYEIKDVKNASGTLTLKEVVTRENDTIAIFDITIKIRGLVDPNDDAFISIEMDGIVERSLTHFYDQKVNLSGTIQMNGKLSEDQHLTMSVPATLIMEQTLE